MTTTARKRALIVIRLSRVTDATTSPERQLGECRALCAQRDYEVVGVAEDLDVSAGQTAPFDRPQLGEWLKPERAHEYDVIVFYRADRLVRRVFDLADMIRWSRANRVTLVSATESHFDLSTDFGDIIALLVAKVAEMELKAISERNQGTFDYNLREGKWRGGVPPWGYLPGKDDKDEWRLFQDPTQADVIREVAERVLEGEPLRVIARDLTDRPVLTPKDRFAEHQGREVQNYEWHSGALKRALLSPTLLGHVVTREVETDEDGHVVLTGKGKKQFGPELVLRNDDGSPLVRSEPVLSRDVFDRVGAELRARENRKEPTARSTSLGLQVVFCGVCGEPAYRLKGGEGRAARYRCASAQKRAQCSNRSLPLEYADDAISGFVLGVLGDSERLARHWDSGSDHTAELADINATLVDLVGQLGTGVYRAGTPQRAALDASIAARAKRQEELSREAVKPAGWTWKPTGEKFSDWWERQDTEARNIWLRTMKVRVGFNTSTNDRGRVQIDGLSVDLGDIQTLTQQVSPGGTATSLADAFEAMRQAGVEGAEIGPDGIRLAEPA
ncbi:recombinase family protein [Nocardia sp. NPDC057663]|uniref:recombinase family protein n=1 Tax=Nocardia sp. NPDC057663 TaxID=3346201 RepID=UPI003671CC03